jgi:hypothetical protein
MMSLLLLIYLIATRHSVSGSEEVAFVIVLLEAMDPGIEMHREEFQ